MAWGTGPSAANNLKTSSSTYTLDVTNHGPNAANQICLAFSCVDNTNLATPTVSSISKGASETNNWQLLKAIDAATSASAGSVVGHVYAIESTGSWSVQPTVTLSEAVTAHAGGWAYQWTGGQLTPSFADQAPTSGTIGQIAWNSGDLVLVVLIGETNSTLSIASLSWTGTSPDGTDSAIIDQYTTGGGAASNAAIRVQARIPSNSSTGSSLTWNPGIDGGFAVIVLPPAGGGTTQKSSSDTASATEAVTVRGIATTETSTATEGASVVGDQEKNSSDTGTATEAASLAATTSHTETGSGTDTASLAAALTDGDTSAATHVITSFIRSGIDDPGSATDVTLSLVVQVTSSDTGSGTDVVASLDQGSEAKSANETGNALDAPESLARTIPGETAQGTDVVSSTGRTGIPEGASASETATLVVEISAEDVSTILDAVTALARTGVAETATGTDVVSSLSGGANPTASDTGSATEAASLTTDQSRTDTGTGTDSASLMATPGTQPDTAAATETALVAASVTGGESVSALEEQTLLATLTRTEQAQATETASLVVLLTAAEVAAVIDAVTEASGPPTARSWHELSATVVMTGGREARV